MMKKILFAFLLYLQGGLPALAFEQKSEAPFSKSTKNKPPLVWLVEDKKENQNLLNMTAPSTSVASYIESQVIKKLDNYQVKLERVSAKRIDHILKTTPNACVANRAKIASREAFSIFSNPQAFYLTHKLFRYNQDRPFPVKLMNDQQEVTELAAVFEHFPDVTIGLAGGISYGEFLDSQIAEIPQANIYYRRGAGRVVALEAMLYSGRIHYLLALPIDINPSQEQKLTLEQYPIAGAPPYLVAYISCSDSQLGQQAIKSINTILNAMYQTDDYYWAHEKWFGENEVLKLQQYFQKTFELGRFIQ